jgi:hypothetical protein
VVRGSRTAAIAGALGLAVVSPAWERVKPYVTEPPSLAARDALERGDVDEARDIAEEISRGETLPWGPGLPAERGKGLRALAVVRDRDSAPAQVAYARVALRELEYPIEASAVGEAAERGGDDADALRLLLPLSDDDRLRSVWAEAALGRALRRSGDEDGAGRAFARCRARTVDARICDGKMPKPAHFRVPKVGYALPSVILGVATLPPRVVDKVRFGIFDG